MRHALIMSTCKEKRKEGLDIFFFFCFLKYFSRIRVTAYVFLESESRLMQGLATRYACQMHVSYESCLSSSREGNQQLICDSHLEGSQDH